jgi:ribosomal protein S27E
MTHLDGNAAAGPLGDVFTHEMTTAMVTCAGCGNRGPLGGAMLYGEAMGTIVRCVACEQVLLRFAETPGGIRLDMRGIGVLAWDG